MEGLKINATALDARTVHRRHPLGRQMDESHIGKSGNRRQSGGWGRGKREACSGAVGRANLACQPREANISGGAMEELMKLKENNPPRNGCGQLILSRCWTCIVLNFAGSSFLFFICHFHPSCFLVHPSSYETITIWTKHSYLVLKVTYCFGLWHVFFVFLYPSLPKPLFSLSLFHPSLSKLRNKSTRRNSIVVSHLALQAT